MPRAFFLILAILCLTITSSVQAVSATGKKDEAPISVEADHMTSLEKSNSVLFTGHVDARQDDVRILTDKMTVYYTPEGKKGAKAATKGGGGERKVEKMVCVGNVKVSRGDWLGVSREMIYLAKARQVQLIGDAKAWQGQNMVSGEKIIRYIDEERSEVLAGGKPSTAGRGEGKTGSGDRVKMVLPQ
ncbi:MAG TPA: lipopolysaccharide transport periplasmic protein LptA [Desulfobulbaceae bacterium]|nr:lipopolysaccharide transport periplasmic protein LptA [Desulfobulbaceae bacterium]